MRNKQITGHLSALVTIIIWGTTFISTKILLVNFQPIEILFFRFLIGFIILLIVYPKQLKELTLKKEVTFAMAGLSGICLYYLLENIALTYTLASNVGVIISTAPFFTAVLSRIFMNKEKLKINFFIGFITAMSGIYLIGFNNGELKFNFVGDILALAASFIWAVYSLLTKKISEYEYNTIQTTRRIFMYGVIFMIPLLFVFDFELNFMKFTKVKSLFNMLFLGIGASAFCFVTWNYAVKLLGAVKTSVYIYIVPVITVIASAVILNEKITFEIVCGTILTLIGLFLSESKLNFKKRGNTNEY